MQQAGGGLDAPGARQRILIGFLRGLGYKARANF
jgi:hypothetical protein